MGNLYIKYCDLRHQIWAGCSNPILLDSMKCALLEVIIYGDILISVFKDLSYIKTLS
jgi:hypothetical protein